MTTLTPQEQELFTLFTERLPKFIDDHPELEPQLYHVFLKTFARKEEVAAVQKELTEFRAEARENFARADTFHTEMEEFREETRENFARINQRFERVDQRFEQVDARFEQVDQRFEQVDQRFEQVDARFEQVDQRFEQVDQHFEQTDKRITDLQAEVRTGFAEVRAEIKNTLRAIDRLGARWGIRNEDLFRETMTSVLEKSFGVTVETRSIQGEQFDLIISNGEHILIEIAAGAKRNALERLTRKRQLYTQETGVVPARFIFAVAVINDRRAQLLREAGFEVIVPDDEAETAADSE
jgi:hypothetical protein